MYRVLITGANGVLGSALSKLFLKLGNDVSAIDIVREEECWRLRNLEIMDQIQYNWKGSQDLTTEDLKGIDLVIDCAIGFPDRPFGTSSPRATVSANLAPAIGLLEAVRGSYEKPPIIYPSSFNSLYGNRGVYAETTAVAPTSIYGWTKTAVEQLYRTYHTSFGIPIIITRVGSGYGEMMRTDELVARLIYSALQKKIFKLKSPYSKRLWTYLGDVVDAYRAIIERSAYGHNERFFRDLKSTSFVLNIAGNAKDQILNNVELSELISEIVGNPFEIRLLDYYEPGELIEGIPVDFSINAEFTRNLLRWKPSHTLVNGLGKTVNWFVENSNRVGIWNIYQKT